MFEVSWGELFVVAAVGVAVTGKKDLPKACRMVGSQLGRVVGLLQGARARADQYASHHELRQIQNELRSGLRELDQVRTELAVAASAKGMVGRNLGATTPSANRAGLPTMGTASSTTIPPTIASSNHNYNSASMAATAPFPKKELVSSSADGLHQQGLATPTPLPSTPWMGSPAVHSEKAVLEDEWEKQGIGYRTRSEELQKSRTALTGNPSGSEILEALLKDSLTWDQYDKVVGEQDRQLEERMATLRQ